MAQSGPLHEQHVAAGAKLADFAGWSMPLEYAGGGVVAEHTAVRTAAGVFDVSHLGKARVAGPGAADFVDSCLTADLGRVEAGGSQYTMCCDETGGVVDDLIVYRRGDTDLLLVPNAANTAEVVSRLRAAAPEGVTVTDEHTEHAVLAVQGPRSDAVLDRLGLPVGHPYMTFQEVSWRGSAVTVCRTGYTGERGYELICGWNDAPTLWDAVVEAVRAEGGLPAGLGARDTLRTEMGYPLHGHELSPQISPVQARAGWAVGWKKPAFWGREALLAQREAGTGPRLMGLLATGRGVPRPELDVLNRAGDVVGRTTSGTFSPTLKQGIALALLDASAVAVDDIVTISIRGRALSARVVNPPFVPDHARD